ncbi:MAG: hypothetical protein JKX97_06605, partial [Candidatus Lindowbacteria bacterium]|nr:hypothetical protein [Candidatus Lindowbacteria bacterium]
MRNNIDFFRRNFLLVAVACVLMSFSASAQTSSDFDGLAIPDVYVATNNSFVISVPNFTRVAVGNAAALLTRVVSPNELLVQGSATVGVVGNGVVDFATSNLYVWSGEKRYVYRVIVVEDNDDTALPQGVTRMDVEPSRIVMWGLTSNVVTTALQVKQLRAAGLEVETRIDSVNLKDLAVEARRLDEEIVDQAIEQKEILQGMTVEEMIMSRGQPLFQPTVSMDAGPGGTKFRVEEYRYPDVIVRVVDGFVDRYFSYVSPEATKPVEGMTIEGDETNLTGRQTKVYKLRYSNTQEVVVLVRSFLSEGGKFTTQDYLGIIIVEDEVENIRAIDQVIRLIDTPRYDNGISIMRTMYIDGMTNAGTGGDKELSLIRMGNMVDNQTKDRYVSEIQSVAQNILEQYVFALDEGEQALWFFNIIPVPNAVVIIAPPGIMDVLLAYTAQNFINFNNDDLQRTVENGGLMQGMTREQVEAALRMKPSGSPRQVQGAGGILWEYVYGPYILRFKSEQLFQILMIPTDAEFADAKKNNMLLWGITKPQLDELLGEGGKFKPTVSAELSRMQNTTAMKIVRYQYELGEAVFSHDRLEEFIPTPSAAIIVPGSLMSLAGSAGMGNIYSRLPMEERQRLIKQGVVISGMSLADVATIYQGVPPTFVNVEISDEGRVTW